jgi:hypothetical protein
MQPAKRNPGLLVTDTVKIVASAAAGLVSGLYSFNRSFKKSSEQLLWTFRANAIVVVHQVYVQYARFGESVCGPIETLREDARFGGSVCGAVRTPKGLDQIFSQQLRLCETNRVRAPVRVRTDRCPLQLV